MSYLRIRSYPFAIPNTNSSTTPANLLILSLKFLELLGCFFKSQQLGSMYGLNETCLSLYTGFIQAPLFQQWSQLLINPNQRNFRCRISFFHILKETEQSFNTWSETTLFSNIKRVTIKNQVTVSQNENKVNASNSWKLSILLLRTDRQKGTDVCQRVQEQSSKGILLVTQNFSQPLKSTNPASLWKRQSALSKGRNQGRISKI